MAKKAKDVAPAEPEAPVDENAVDQPPVAVQPKNLEEAVEAVLVYIEALPYAGQHDQALSAIHDKLAAFVEGHDYPAPPDYSL